MNESQLDDLLVAMRPAPGWTASVEGQQVLADIRLLSANNRASLQRRRRLGLAALVATGVAAATAIVAVLMSATPWNTGSVPTTGYRYDINDLSVVLSHTTDTFLAEVVSDEGAGPAGTREYSVRVERILEGELNVSELVRVGIRPGGDTGTDGLTTPLELEPGGEFIFAANLDTSSGIYLAAPGPFGVHAVLSATDARRLLRQYQRAAIHSPGASEGDD